ncbi:leucine-rich repeat domain, L domain-like protein [Artemisia annua]|uniref:Leucine-rich repeat domain, L domain-like protein n=1 Tax=Artemisia annua TaxID=35608 RepID=A0A2U1P6Q6_ARTAN|nr:leucine-rich repeat domain, L domain-like protein [Artemisia annua]
MYLYISTNLIKLWKKYNRLELWLYLRSSACGRWIFLCLANVTDVSLVEISSKCTRIQHLYLNGCVAITGKPLRAFTNSASISELQLVNCSKISWNDVVSIASTFDSKVGYAGITNPNNGKTDNRIDKGSFYQVSKEFMRARCITLRRLSSSVLSLLEVVLPASQNLLRFRSSAPLHNSYMKLLAQSCQNLQEWKLNRHIDLVPPHVDVNFDNDGVSELIVCIHLIEVDLSGRMKVGDFGVVSLVRSSRNIECLTLEGCINVIDEA